MIKYHGVIVCMCIPVIIRSKPELTKVESGSDDGQLYHCFDGSGGSHLQTKLFGCDSNF